MSQENSVANPRRIVVAIGASAGGLRPLQELFAALPTNLGMSYIVVQHLSPDFESMMDELLARHTSMKICVADQGMTLEPDTIYLNPPRMDVDIVNHKIVLRQFDPTVLRLPINCVFESIAREYGCDAVAVVLSGTGSDGSLGLKTVQEMSGLTVVQSLETAQFDGMPKNAIATRGVDYVLSPPAIAHLLREHAKTPMGRQKDLDTTVTTDDEAIQSIFTSLSQAFGIDFEHYKPSTVSRRIDRRLNLSRFPGLRQYAEVLKKDRTELSNLYHDLLIGVTCFFRDQDAFSVLRNELDTLVASSSGGPLRIWCAGCATGEEAYTLTMLLVEVFEQRGMAPNFKVFATDVYDGALEIASDGVFDVDTMQTLSQKQRARFFEPVDDQRFRVLPILRNHLIFARQNVVNDPPFTNVDLVTCRNLLIYLQDDAQQRAISGFRFALKSNGLMMLGPSESLGKIADGFSTIDKDWRVFRKNDRVFAGGIAQKRFAAPLSSIGKSSTYELVKAQTARRIHDDSASQILGSMVDAILISYEHRIEQLFGNIEKFFPNRGLIVGNHLLDHFDSSELATIYALQSQATKEVGVTCVARNVPWGKHQAHDCVQLKATALNLDGFENPAVLMQVLTDQLPTNEETTSESATENTTNPVVDSLQGQLDSMRETLGDSIQELEASNEEMQSANEEMIASNEEMQATNEELQSVNEELRTVNIEHHRKVQELQEVTDDFNNLFNSTRVGLILLDENLLIRKFTSATSKYFNLLQHDVGRPLSNFAPKLRIDDLFARVREVISGGKRYSVNVLDADGHTIALEVMPYRSSNLVNGAIISLIDVTAAHGDSDALTSSSENEPGDSK